MPAVSVVGSTNSLVRRAVRGVLARGLEVATSVSATDTATLAGALDNAARHPATSCVLVYAHRIGSFERFSSVCQAVTPHLPVLFVAAGEFASDPALRPWLESTGAVELPSLSSAFDAIPIAGALDLPAENRCVVVGGDEALVAAATSTARRAGFQTEARKGSTLADALGDLANDLVIAVVAEPNDHRDRVAVALGEARAAHPELPLIIVAEGEPEWAASIRSFVDAGSVCVLDSSVDVAIGLRVLAQWETRRRAVATPAARPRDATRLRRFVKSSPDAFFTPSPQAELVGALGLPVARAVRAPYLEDALVAAAALGYPLRLAAVHATMRPPNEPRWVEVRSSTELSERADQELATKARELGRRAELLLAESNAQTTATVRVVAERHEQFGTVVALRHSVHEELIVPPAPVDGPELVHSLSLVGDEASAASALVDGISAVTGALNEIPSITRIGLVLDIGGGGFKVRHATLEVGP